MKKPTIARRWGRLWVGADVRERLMSGLLE